MRIKFRQGYDGPAGSFSAGDIEDLDIDTAIDICNAGLAYPTKEKKTETQMKEYPHHKGGGYYILSNGDQVRGKEKAAETEKKLG